MLKVKLSETEESASVAVIVGCVSAAIGTEAGGVYVVTAL
jgi:hypothetical protein